MFSQQFISYVPSNWGLLLYYAAASNDVEMTRRLIRIGANINLINSELKTPLMIAVERRSVEVVEVLLKANADILIVDIQGRCALQLLFESVIFDERIFKAFVERFSHNSLVVEEFLIRLINTGCSMYHAAVLRDFEIMNGILERGVSIDSTNNNGRTALHVAVHRQDLYLVEWLLKNRANINALDNFNQSPLYEAACNGDVELVHTLLENNANPNIIFRPSPLYQVFKMPSQLFLIGNHESKLDECVELLLQHGAIPQDPIDPTQKQHFELALINKNFTKLRYLICHLAVLDRRGFSIGRSMMWCRMQSYQKYYFEIRMYYKLCQEKLKVKCGTLSLFDLLTASDNEMIIYARNKTLVYEIESICSEMRESHTYYTKTLEKRISKAVYIVMLEEVSILVIPKLFNGNYNQCYNFARKVVRYLDMLDLEQLYLVGLQGVLENSEWSLLGWSNGNH